MTRPTGTRSLAVQRVVFCVLAAVVFLEVGCVSRRTYEKVKAETLEQTQALEAVRGDVRELDQEIAGLQASNRREDAAMSELRAAIQREEEQLPIVRQRAEDAFASLKTQVATLMNQSWQLARKIVDIRQESVSLQAKVAQYKEKIERPQASVTVDSERAKLVITEPVISEESISSVGPTQNSELTQVAQAAHPPSSLAPLKAVAPSPSVKIDPPSIIDSWIDMITSWLSKIWNWLLA
jgi:lipopolysaccharide export LptBFGC system permease protein LptF